MASTFTTNIRLEKQGDGENPNSWGTILNANVIDLVDQAVAAYQIVSVSGTTPLTLSQVNGATDQSRKAILSFDGTLTAETSIIIPSVNKMYYVRNNTSGSFSLKVKTAGNTAITIEQGSNIMVATDGTNVFKTAFPTSVSSFTANSLTATSVSTSILNATKVSTSVMKATQVSATAIHATSVSAVSGRFSGTVSASAFDGLGNKLSFGSDAQGDVYYYAGSNIARLPAGTSGQFLQTKGSGANPAFVSAAIAKKFESAAVSLTGAGGLLTIAHTLSTTPFMINAHLVCQVSSFGYAVGDKIAYEFSPGSTLSANNCGITCRYDDSNFYVRAGSNSSYLLVLNGSSGDLSAVPEANFKIVVKATA